MRYPVLSLALAVVMSVIAFQAVSLHGVLASASQEHEVNLPLLLQKRPATDMTTLKWLDIVNQVRREASVFTEPLPAWEEKVEYSRGAWLHARYIVMLDFPAHFELPSPWTTEEGAKTALHSVILASSTPYIPVERVIYAWLSAPFHGGKFFRESIRYVGFGTFSRSVGLYQFAAVMDVLSDYYDRQWDPNGRYYGAFDAWPGPDTVLPYRAFAGGEYPDPLRVCPGYTYPVGPPIYLFSDMADGQTSEVASARLTDSRGQELDICVQTVVDWPDETQMDRVAANVLFSLGMALIIPKYPLQQGQTYRVEVSIWNWDRVRQQHYAWQFRVAENAIFDPLFPDETEAYRAIETGVVPHVRRTTLGIPFRNK